MAAIVIRYPDGTEQEQELAGQLTVGRARQVSIPAWKPPVKKG